jgi:hypothetical protein
MDSRDGLDCVGILDEQNLDPEQRQVELMFNQRELEEKISWAEAEYEKRYYGSFLSEGKKFYEGDAKKYASARKRLLTKYFPRRFGENGSDPIQHKNPNKVFGQFRRLIDYSRKKINE